MDIQAILDNLENYTEVQKNVINLALEKYEGRTLELAVRSIVDELDYEEVKKGAIRLALEQHEGELLDTILDGIIGG